MAANGVACHSNSVAGTASTCGLTAGRSRVFQALDPVAFAAFFIQFTAAFGKRHKALVGSDAIAIDGKTLRGSFDHAAKKLALNMVTA